MKLPRHTPQQVLVVIENLRHANFESVGLGLLALAILIFWPKKWRAVPASIVAVVVPTIVIAVFHPAVQTIGTKFGGIPADCRRSLCRMSVLRRFRN